MNQISFLPLPDPNLEVLYSQFLDVKYPFLFVTLNDLFSLWQKA
ncbi:hypothetical protein SAMN05444673_7114 [Bacillus sp. OV166]|jgi:hypothetical protein|nr:hypothetical protein SAMN05444673_7114 [Bacillus sp. OV166]